MPEGQISFPGVLDPRYLIATRTLGTKPDVSVIYATPQPGTPDCSGTATLSFGFNGVTINMANALCDRGTLMLSTHGHTQVFEIKDRRWRWERVFVTQAFNVRMADGSIDPVTIMSLQGIIYFIFSVMGEFSADVSLITSTEYPEIVLDHDSCADSLDEILIPRGYVVSLQTNDNVAVYPRGEGSVLTPNEDLVNATITLNPPEIPYYLTACWNYTLVQSMLMCLPVGLDTDGSVKDVNLLSYMPVGGWGRKSLITFDYITDATARECAKRTVGKWYQVASQADGTQELQFGGVNYLPGEIAVSDASQLLPIEPLLLEATTDVYGKKAYDPPYVTGLFFEGTADTNPPKGKNTDPFTRVDHRDWTLDRVRGIVKFRQLAIKEDVSAHTFTFADVFATCSYAVHPTPGYVKDRMTTSIILGGYGEDLRKRNELQRQIIAGYTAGTATLSSLSDNQGLIAPDAVAYLLSAAATYSIAAGSVLLYRGIYPFNVDGISMQIRWNCAINGDTPWGTLVAQNVEGIPILATMSERAALRWLKLNSDPLNVRRRKFRAGRISVR